MDAPQPWLDELIGSSLDAWFERLEGADICDYQFRKVGQSLKIRFTCVRFVRLLRLGTPNLAESRGQVSDGKHIIDTVVPKNTFLAFRRACITEGTILRLTNPTIRVTAHVSPPQPLLEIWSWDIAPKELQRSFSNHESRYLTQEWGMSVRMARYDEAKDQNRAASSTPRSSSPSLASQIRYSPRKQIEAEHEDDSSQLPFFTQVLPPIWYQEIYTGTTQETGLQGPVIASHSASTNADTEEHTKLQAPRLIGASSQSEDSNVGPAQDLEIEDKGRSLQITGANLTSARSPVASTPLPSSLPSLQTRDALPRQPSLPTELEKSSPIETAELGAQEHVDPPGPVLLDAEERSSVPAAVLVRSESKRVEPSATRSKPFQRWRHHTRAGKNLPRQHFRIPRGQEAYLGSLLEKGDSWQPPLVGHLQRPGDVPFALLKQFDEAADRLAEQPQAVTCDHACDTSHQTEAMSSPVTNDSDNSDAVAWSQSQPTQERRARPAPLASEESSPTHSGKSSSLSSSPPISPSANIAMPQSSPPLQLQYRPAAAAIMQSPERRTVHEALVELAWGSTNYKSPSRHSEVHVESTPSVAETPSSKRSIYAVQVGSERFETVNLAGTQIRIDGNVPTIQVKETPYPGKGVGQVRKPAREIVDLDPGSSFVPATFKSPAAEASYNTRDAGHTPVSSSEVKAVEDNRMNADLPEPAVASKQPDNALLETLGIGIVTEHLAQSVPQSSSTASNIPCLPLTARNRSSETASMAEGPSKRKADNLERDNPTRKRHRSSAPIPAVDPDYFAIQERTRAHRREQLQAIRKPLASLRQSTSSSAIELGENASSIRDRSGGARQHLNQQAKTAAGLLSSTPNTRRSMYEDGASSIDKILPRYAESRTSSMSARAESSEPLFLRYQEAYPDYEGTVDDFRESYSFIQGVLNDNPKKIHSSLLDDAVFHVYHSYQPYREGVGSNAMTFIEFFNDRIEDPSHHKRVVKFGSLGMVGRNHSRLSLISRVSDQQEQLPMDIEPLPKDPATPESSPKDEIEKARQSFLRNTVEVSEVAVSAKPTLSQESVQSIERWRETAARGGSPELGSSDIHRSLLQTSRHERPAQPSVQPSVKEGEDLVASNAPEHSSAAQSRPLPTEDRSSRNAGLPKPHVESSIINPNNSTESGSKVNITRARQVSIAMSAISSSGRHAKHANRLGSGTNTAFTDFEKKYSRLYASQKEAAAIRKGTSVARDGSGKRGRSSGKGIDPFAWR